jgi:hypothetical protein
LKFKTDQSARASIPQFLSAHWLKFKTDQSARASIPQFLSAHWLKFKTNQSARASIPQFSITYFVFLCILGETGLTDDVMLTVTPILPRMDNKSEEPNPQQLNSFMK